LSRVGRRRGNDLDGNRQGVIIHGRQFTENSRTPYPGRPIMRGLSAAHVERMVSTFTVWIKGGLT
jgi:hypothetical protein